MSQSAFITFSRLPWGLIRGWMRQRFGETGPCVRITQSKQNIYGLFIALRTLWICCDMGNHFSCENTLLVPPCNGSKLKYLTITIISYTYYENSRHMLLSFTVSLSLLSVSPRSVFWSHKDATIISRSQTIFYDGLEYNIFALPIVPSSRAPPGETSWEGWGLLCGRGQGKIAPWQRCSQQLVLKSLQACIVTLWDPLSEKPERVCMAGLSIR